jgi:hypothetical protein
MITPLTQFNLSSIEHAWFEYHVAESMHGLKWFRILIRNRGDIRLRKSPIFNFILQPGVAKITYGTFIAILLL